MILLLGKSLEKYDAPQDSKGWMTEMRGHLERSLAAGQRSISLYRDYSDRLVIERSDDGKISLMHARLFDHGTMTRTWLCSVWTFDQPGKPLAYRSYRWFCDPGAEPESIAYTNQNGGQRRLASDHPDIVKKLQGLIACLPTFRNERLAHLVSHEAGAREKIRRLYDERGS